MSEYTRELLLRALQGYVKTIAEIATTALDDELDVLVDEVHAVCQHHERQHAVENAKADKPAKEVSW